MALRAASGRTAVRWAYGVLLTLCVALAVLVHHESSAMGVPPMTGAAHAGHAMVDTHSLHDSGCAAPGMQHCAAATVDSVQLASPEQSALDPVASPGRVLAGRAPAPVTGRAPPDLSVLSQLRI